MPLNPTTTGRDVNVIVVLAEILALAANESGTMDDTRDFLNAIEDAATAALFGALR